MTDSRLSFPLSPLTVWIVLCVLVQAGVGVADDARIPEKVDFNFHVRPILSDRCFACHGPDRNKREAELRLDTQKGAFAALEDGIGSHVIKPGVPKQSEVYLRISSDDEDVRMPPPDSKLSLTNREIAVIKRWIEQGAEWTRHWSLIPLEDVRVPQVADTNWPKNEIDHFVLRRLESEGLGPASEAPREKLIRRLSFDLTGLPPTIEEIDAFLADDSPNAYEKLVDRLLKSSRYGERMAVDWLDLARYADTYGYQSDVHRDMWPWRDWVVKAFNQNLPYDQFITWQLAGDLLPKPSRDQIVATAFNRHHRQTNEGGSIEAEFRVEYVADRTNTFGSAFLGFSLGCARCHDHKYDPVSQKEYYQLFAFFNNIDESGLYSHFTNATPTPTLPLTDAAQQRRISSLNRQISEAEAKLALLTERRRGAFHNWLKLPPQKPAVSGLVGDYPLDQIEKNQVINRIDPKTPGKLVENPQLVAGKKSNGLKLSGENNVTLPVGGKLTRNDPFSITLWMKTPNLKHRAVIFHRSRAWTDAGSRGYQLLLEEGRLSASLIHFWPGNAIRIRTVRPISIGQWVHVVMTYDGSSLAGGLNLYVNGRLAECDIVRDKLTKNITGGGATSLVIGQRFRDKGFKNGLVDEFQVYNRELTGLEAAHVFDDRSLEDTFATPASRRTGKQQAALFRYYLANHDSVYRDQLQALRKLRVERSQAVDSVPEIMVMKELSERRPTFLLRRGAYDAPGDRVEPGTPASFPAFREQWPRNRLGLAKWLTHPQHPLTARVAVNRFWQTLFGQGLVATPEDFGSQGELPSHPQLLDWLSKTFIENGWNVKRLTKRIVMSAVYRQSSATSPQARRRDLENRLLARGPSYRLPAEMIRDNALFVSGLLVEKIGGPPVKPYQPAGLWKEKSGKTYQRNVGEGSHRRSLYTYWKRTSPPPAMMTLDAAKRDVCVVKRQTTATPLQSLVLLNDPQYVEAARALAERVLTQAGRSLDERIVFAFRTLTSRAPNQREMKVLRNLYREQFAEFNARPGDAKKFLSIGDHKRNEKLDVTELAAMTVLTKALLNFDATVTKR